MSGSKYRVSMQELRVLLNVVEILRYAQNDISELVGLVGVELKFEGHK